MDGKIDIRIMKLNKWYVPKSFDLHNVQEPVVLGYFDALDVRGLKEKDALHPFTAGYKELARLKAEQKTDLVDFASQEQMLFLNIDNGTAADGTAFTVAEVEAFWSDMGETCPYRYVTMIHIGQSDKLSPTLKRIKREFGKDYLSYISFDFCDIVLFANNRTIPEYLHNIRKLFSGSSGEDNPVFDTFSMVSFWPPRADGVSWKAGSDVKDEFQATINISIRDHKKFREWYDTNIENKGKHGGEEQEYKLVRYDLYGRHDVSIVNDKADTKWLMEIMTMLHDRKNQEMFWTFETFIKVEHSNDNVNEVSADSRDINAVYQAVKDNLNKEIRKFKEVIEKADIRDASRYILPLYEVRDCICSIVKNNFAEEFVCCIYESFLHFVSYMGTEIGKLDTVLINRKNREEEIAGCYDEYFVALNTLVNSIMHNERQFVQATAFSAVFCFVPPKIMAFYNAYIYRIKQILRDEDCKKQYTFLIYPSFSSIISVRQISLDDEPPCDRILTVTISEKSLYDIESVMYQMVHELAHYVGSGLRCRSIRTQKIMDTLLKWIAAKCEIGEEGYPILKELTDVWCEKASMAIDTQRVSVQQCVYLRHFFSLGDGLRRFLLGLRDVPECLETYYQKMPEKDESFHDEFLDDIGIGKEYQKAYIANYGRQYADVKFHEFRNHFKKLNTDGSIIEYRNIMKLIKSVYRECYADLQMILVLKMEAEDYLSTFLVNQEVSAQGMVRIPKDMIRISTIFRIMIDSGLWNAPKEQDDESFRIVFGVISRYNEKIVKSTEDTRIQESRRKLENLSEKAREFDFRAEDGIHLRKGLKNKQIDAAALQEEFEKITPLVDIAAGLYEYLLEVLEESLNEYAKSDKPKQIQEVREKIKTVLNFEDVIGVFDCIEKEISAYKRDGCKIQ